MYRLIKANTGIVWQTIPKDEVGKHASLVQNLRQQVGTPGFQDEYRRYWGAKRFHSEPNWNAYWTDYFQELQTAVQIQTPPNLSALATKLYNVTPTRGNGTKTPEFSYATKLLHMVSRHSPIFDGNVAAFYFYRNSTRSSRMVQQLRSRLAWHKRLNDYVNFHNFLIQEYSRILTKRLLDGPIQAFRRKFPKEQQHSTDERIIDLLIWAYVRGVGRALMSGQVTYH